MITETPTSQITDDAVRARLRDEDPEFYAAIPAEFLPALEPMRRRR
jgi:hypothetical protein